MNIDLEDIESRINEGIYGDDRMTDTGRDDAFAALALLLDEVKRLRAYVGDLKRHGASLHKAAAAGRDAERAAVVAWLREWGSVGRIATGDDYANEIERGEHRREEKP
jgi:hypothetical protein